ncbi:sigma factor-like helix-turn-helix DNA-binding protein [Alicyclobacillus macrosporangiidus]|uniref:sigma factor-like helix-turn-helix DNA-binding protein n=1 Tax=Alicyclobacillus macrosporangiidus TaxID=392015 RepID=UPI0026EFF7AE|nr:sigma factor-like helix-turn-helix DNA-binding protein [Alicyclobacillus macrosporangiidus]
MIVFYYFHDFSIEEISGILRVRQGTVKSRLHKARKLMASRLREMDREAELKGAVCFDERP